MASRKLKFVGRPDYFVSGVPQRDLTIVEAEPIELHEVSIERAAELVATGLYEYEAKKSAQAAAEEKADG